MRCDMVIREASDPATRCMLQIPPIANMQCQLVVESYYGGKWGAARELFKQALHQSISERWLGFLIWFSDRMGWTKLYDMPETTTHHGYQMRHGRKCHGSPNCAHDCISESQPKWFRRLCGKEDL